TGLQAAALSYSSRVGPFTFALALAGVAVFAAGWQVLGSGTGTSVAPGRPRWSPVVAGGLLIAATPLACLAQAAVGAERWAALPASGFLVAAEAAVVGVGLVGPWRHRRFGPAIAIAVATVLAIAFDLVTGSRGQLTSLIGYS